MGRTGAWIVVVGLVVAVPADALAYLDPATGSAVLQAIVGGLLAGVFVLKQYWRQLQARLTRKRADGRPSSDQS
jgi:hypothetical protein